jgi:import receptor subunit TOM20
MGPEMVGRVVVGFLRRSEIPLDSDILDDVVFVFSNTRDVVSSCELGRSDCERWMEELEHGSCDASLGQASEPKKFTSFPVVQQSTTITLETTTTKHTSIFTTDSHQSILPPTSHPSGSSTKPPSSPFQMASTTPSSGPSTTAIALATAGAITIGALSYALYFDHKRRSDPEFRKYLKKQHKKVQKVHEESAKAAERSQKQKIRTVVDEANEEGFPHDPEETEAYFMQEVARGEAMCQDGGDPVDAALCFYKALKVYPQPRELISIYDKTVPKVSESCDGDGYP